MSESEWKRLDVVKRLEKGALSVGEAARVLGLSPRQVKRLRRAYREGGAKALRHGNLGRSPANRVSAGLAEQVLALRRGKYAGFNDTHFGEKLASVEKCSISRASVQRLLRAAKIGSPQTRRARKHRARRERKAQAGLMLLWDGSKHAWLEARGPKLCLLGAIDDATSEFLTGARFVEEECAAGYLTALRDLVRARGVPHSIYMDRHGSLRRNDDWWTLEEELRGEQEPTQVGHALKALGITPIFALSAQAKGRVERLWRTLQDRLTSELRLAEAKTMEEANEVLQAFIPVHNARFAQTAASGDDAWRPLRRHLDLDRLCSFRYEATVGNDNAVRVAGQVVIDIPPGRQRQSFAKARVELRQLLDGSWRVYRGDELLATAPSTAVGELRAAKRRKRPAASRAFRRALHELSTS